MPENDLLNLSDEAIRVLGVLIEKEKTTPDNYPLTLNSLVAGSNKRTKKNTIFLYGELEN